ncbi:hypothetical protein LTR15_001611 [Elasticomyces elasticus]|nr:hypothetical protein LTR15_001611 [Elasticomyces elasticus]
MSFTVIRKSLLLSIEQKPVPLPLGFAVYFKDISPSLAWAVIENLTLPYRARKHKDKAVSPGRLLGWLYLCCYVLIVPTLISAMTGYQTAGTIFWDPENGFDSLVGTSSLTPNPSLIVRDGYRVGLQTDELVALDLDNYGSQRFDQRYNTILGYYLATQNALHNATWRPTVSQILEPDLQAVGPIEMGIPQWAYCTVSKNGNFCASENEYGGHYTSPPANVPDISTPLLTWSNITIDNKTHVLQPPPLDIAWAAPARTWAMTLSDDVRYTGYFTNASIARTAVCQPSVNYKWGFSAILLFLFCCMTIAFAGTILRLELTIWLYSRSNLYRQNRSGYKDAMHVVQVLKEEFGEDLAHQSAQDIDSRIKSYTGAMYVETGGLELPRRQSGFLRRKRAGDPRDYVPEIPLLEPSKSGFSNATTM